MTNTTQPLIHVWSAGFSGPWADVFFQQRLQLLSPADQGAILRYRRWEDRQLKLLGRMLLLRALESLDHDPAMITTIALSEHGKPHLPGGPWFNISHSGSRAVCAVSTSGPVGIDVEQCRPITLDDYLPVLSPAEVSRIRTSPDTNRAFFELWTAKESVSKADGRGFGIDLKYINPENGSVGIQGTTYLIYPVTLADENYICRVATANNNCLIRIHEMGIDKSALNSSKTNLDQPDSDC